MADYLVKMYLTVAGIGSMQTQDKPIKRTVTAANIEEAIQLAQKDILSIEVLSAEKVIVPVI